MQGCQPTMQPFIVKTLQLGMSTDRVKWVTYFDSDFGELDVS